MKHACLFVFSVVSQEMGDGDKPPESKRRSLLSQPPTVVREGRGQWEDEKLKTSKALK